MVTVKAGALADLVRDIFAKAGCSAAEAERIGKYLVSANLTGHDSHGVVRVPRYVQWKKDRRCRRRSRGQDRHRDAGAGGGRRPARLRPDGGAAGGHDRHREVQEERPLDGCPAQCRAHRPGRRLGGDGGAEAGFVSVHFVNASGSVLVAPFGGTERRLSTAPFVVGVPRPGQTPVILDFATSIVAEGKVLVASQGGKKLPDNALIDRDGKMGTDPHLLYGDYTATGPRDHSKGKGAIRAFGEHKGSGLALMCELLGGSLTGMSATGEGRRFGNGMLSFYIDPKVVDPEAMFSDDVARYIAYFKSAKPATPGGEVLIPGEPEQRTRAQRSKDGVPLPDDTWASILATAREVGVDENRIQQAGRLRASICSCRLSPRPSPRRRGEGEHRRHS